MAHYKLSVDASNDVFEIANFTIEKFGIEQSRRYKHQLEQCLKNLAANPYIGRDASEFSTGLRRFPFKAHTIFYIIDTDGIFVVRILGGMMDYNRHL